MIQALVKGEVDFVDGISALQVESLQGRDGITAVNGIVPAFDEIGLNTGSVDLETGEPIGDPNPALLDPAFRFALGYAIDRDLIIERVYQGAGEPASTIIPAVYDRFHWEPPEDMAYEFDPDRAGELLDEAGYTMGDDGFRTLPDGEPIGTLRLIARSESTTSLDVMEYFQEWLADIGIRSEVTAMESSKLTSVILEGTFDAFEWGWYVDPDPTSMLSYMTCDQRGNWSDSWYCNEEYDALYEQQQVETDPEARAEMVQRDAGDPLHGRALPGVRLQCGQRGVPQRPVRLPAAPAGSRRRLPLPVRRLQLREHAAGRRGRRLWRRRERDEGDRGRRGRRREHRRADRAGGGGGGRRRWSRRVRAASSGDDGGPRVTRARR